MSAKQDKSGKWSCQFWYEDIYGKRHHKCKRGFDTEEDALAFERQFVKRANGSMDMTFADFVDVYFTDMAPKLRDYTRNTREYMLNGKVIPVFGKKRMRDITTLDIVEWQNGILTHTKENGDPYSETYIRSLNCALAAVLNHAERFYGLVPNPMKKAPGIGSKSARSITVWAKDDYLKFSEAILDDREAFIAFELLYWTGIRLGELLALVPDDFDFTASELRITKSFRRLKGIDRITPPKTPKSVRTIALPEFLRDEVRDYIYNYAGIAHDERLFSTLSDAKLRAIMRKACLQTGAPIIRIHDLRHSHVSLLIDMGFSAVAIGDRTGHESQEITLRYGHMFPDSQGKMADALQHFRDDDDAV